jgi:hypothetical protein
MANQIAELGVLHDVTVKVSDCTRDPRDYAFPIRARCQQNKIRLAYGHGEVLVSINSQVLECASQRYRQGIS